MRFGALSKADLHLLTVFITVAEMRGFSAAQVTLNVSASTISRQISHLETRLGMRLCQRGRSGFRLTAKGRSAYDAAKKLLAAVEEFGSKIDAARSRMTGLLSIAVIENWVADDRLLFASALAEFKTRAPAVQIELSSPASDEIEHAVLESRVNFGIGVFHRHKPGIEYEVLIDDPVELFCGRGNPLFGLNDPERQKESIRKADLVRRAYLSEEQVAPKTGRFNSTAIAHQIEGIAFLILSGKFIGYLPVHYASRWVDAGRMRSILPEEYRLQTKIEIATRRGSVLSPIAQSFLKVLKARAQSPG